MTSDHKKPQTLIIRFLLLATGLAAPQPGRGAAAQIHDANVACPSCIVLVAEARDVPPASTALANTLQGLSLAIRAGDASWAEVERAVAAATTMGIRPGLMVRLDVMPPPEMLHRAPFVIMESSADRHSGDVLRIRQLVTSIRAANPRAIVALESGLLSDEHVPAAAVISYIDVLVDPFERDPNPSHRTTSSTADTLDQAAGNIPRWLGQARIDSPTVADLVSASLASEGARAVQEVGAFQWVVLAGFIALRAPEAVTSASRRLTVAEIVARHQAQRRRQEQILHTVVAHGTTMIAFEAPGFTAPITITASTVMYSRTDLTDYELRDVRVNGAAIAGGDAATPPRLPLLEPQRVAVSPLTLTLDEAYEYELVGEEQAAGRRRYVVAFRPLATGTLAHGTAWIDADDFSLARIHFVQTGLHGPIVSSEHDEELERLPVGELWVTLPRRTRIFQMYEGAGHRTPIARELVFDRYDVNPGDFDTRRREAHASPAIMLRETADGLRYLLRQSSAQGGEGVRAVAMSAGERLRTVVVGVIDDPGITRPLPFAGLSYVDLNLFGTGTQMSAFFGGSYGQLSWSVPTVSGPSWELHGRAFGIAARYNDRAFHRGVERYDENLRQRPASVSAGVTRRVSPRVRLRADYELNVTAFSRAETTASAFVIPPTAVVHGISASLEAERGGWSGRAWWNPARRQRWRSWGADGDFTREATEFQRYGTEITRTTTLTRTFLSRVQVAWMAGADLDRFSRYGFDSFENLLHGYSAASIRYDRGTVARSTMSWTAKGWRVDAFGDLAIVHDPAFGQGMRRYPGVGAAFQAPGPFETLWSVECGYGLKAPPTSTGSGARTLRITAYRTF